MFGLKKFVYVSLQTILFDTPFKALLFLPAYVTVSKLIPDDVEASIFAIIKAIQACGELVYGRIFGALIYGAIGEFSNKLGGTIVAFGFCILSALIMISLLWMLPN